MYDRAEKWYDGKRVAEKVESDNASCVVIISIRFPSEKKKTISTDSPVNIWQRYARYAVLVSFLSDTPDSNRASSSNRL